MKGTLSILSLFICIEATIAQCPITNFITKTNVTCFGASDGTATANPSGGGGPYTYLWMPSGQTTQTATGLMPWITYTLTVNDTTPCTPLVDSVIINEPSNPYGLVIGSTTVCHGSNSGTLTLTGFSGSIIGWIFSNNGGLTWTPLINTTPTQTFLNLNNNRLFAAIVQNGTCGSDTSSIATITVNPQSVGGTVSSSTTVCAGANSGTLTLGGRTGTVIRWEISTDGGSNWFAIANTAITQTYNNLTTTTMYRAVVQSGVCPAAASVPATITVQPVSNGGFTFGSTTVCSGTNSGNIVLTGNVGTILNWASSTDGGITWTTLTNNSNTQPYTNLDSTTSYIALVQSGSCPVDTSNSSTIIVNPNSIGGTIAGSTSVCSSTNSGTLTLSGFTGNVIRWELSTDNGVTWLTVSNTTATQNYVNLPQTTIYRAIVKSGICNESFSATAVITVSPASAGGTTAGSTAVCSGLNGGIISLSGNTGSIINWLSSTDGGTTWMSIADTFALLTYSNLDSTTIYASVVQSGVCSVDTSLYSTITVNPKPKAAFGVLPVCFGETSFFIDSSSIASGSIVNYIWNFGDSTGSVAVYPFHQYLAPSIYAVTLRVISDQGCIAVITHPAKVKPLPNPTITASGVTSFCIGDSVALSGENSLMYLWSTFDTTQTIIIAASGMYHLRVTSLITGCVNYDSMEVVVYNLPIAFAGNDTTISLGSSFELNGMQGIYFLWSPSTGLSNPNIYNPIAEPLETTIYHLRVTDSHGCFNSDSIIINVDNDYLFTVSNALTPNGDGQNDVWNIQNIENYPDNSVNIYNRYGQEIYSAAPYKNEWDGTYNGLLMPDGTYYYVLKFKGSEKIFKGGVTIINSGK